MMTREKVLFFCSQPSGMLECEDRGIAGRLQREMLGEGLVCRTERAVIFTPDPSWPSNFLGNEARTVTIVRYHLTDLGLERFTQGNA